MKKTLFLLLFLASCFFSMAQLELSNSTINHTSIAGRKVGVTQIEVHWNAPGVKGREGKVWGSDIAPFGFQVLGFGSEMPSPWRAGADENTTISFSTDVMINGQKLPAGNYGFFIALFPDSCTLIFNKNTKGWGAYFYNPDLDVLRIKTIQQKEMAISKERLEYSFSKQTDRSVELALEWEKWRIPIKVEVDLLGTTLASIRAQLTGDKGFNPQALEQAANWCLQNNVNFEEGLKWINRATDPNLGGVQNFGTLSTKSGLLAKTGKSEEAAKIMQTAVDNGTAIELHQYGRQLLQQKKTDEALAIFQKNYTKHKGAWPTNAGLMRGYSAAGNYKKALEHAKLALAQAPNEENKKVIENAIKTLSDGKPI